MENKEVLKKELVKQLTNDNEKVFVIREDLAQVIKEPVITKINGLICSVRKWIAKRSATLVLTGCHIIVDRVNMSITLIADEANYYGGIISGSLKLNPEMEKFFINKDKSYTPDELANLFKMNRHYFVKPEIAMRLVALLKNFEAKVNIDLKETSNDRGSAESRRIQAVTSNIPEGFTLNMQIFLGMGKVKFDVEINIDARSLNCSLISPNLIEMIESVRDSIIDEELKPLQEYTIIEI